MATLLKAVGDNQLCSYLPKLHICMIRADSAEVISIPINLSITLLSNHLLYAHRFYWLFYLVYRIYSITINIAPPSKLHFTWYSYLYTCDIPMRWFLLQTLCINMPKFLAFQQFKGFPETTGPFPKLLHICAFQFVISIATKNTFLMHLSWGCTA